MSTVKLTTNIYKNPKFIKNVINFNGYNTTRSVAVVTDAERYEVPELATAKPFKEIPGIPSFPLIGSTWIYFPIIGRYSIKQLHKADKHKNEVYGDIVREKFGHLNVVSCFNPEAMEVISRHEGKYPFRGEITSLKAYRESRKEWFRSTGVMILEGKEWHDLRTKTQKHLMKPKTIQAYLLPMQEVARDLVKRLYERRNNNNEVDGLLEDLYKWALESVAYVGLDTRLGCLDRNLAAGSDGSKVIESVQTQFYCMNELEALNGNIPFWKYLPSPTWKKYTKACDIFTEIAYKYINRSLDDLKKRADEDRDLTMLQSMLMTKGLDVSEAMVMVTDMLFAGIDTTSHAVGFLMYHLSKNPDKQKILADEIRQLLPNKEDRITPDVFRQLHYLKACIKESHRLHPIVRGIGRSLDHDVAINGYRIPAGTMIFCVHQQMYKNEKYFKNANKFNPERWLSKDDKLANPYAYFPFGVGVRSCIGRRLAELEIICLATEIIRNFDLKYHYEDVDMYSKMINVPDKPLRFTFLDR